MRNILEIYEAYEIMPCLREHQLRVATVGKMICDAKQGIDKEGIVTALLLHDMGNIIKFDLARYPQFLEQKGLSYWQGVQGRWREKYEGDEHIATKRIVEEIGLSQKVRDYIKAVGFTNISWNIVNGSAEQKICNYADMRVGPNGIVTIAERIVDGKKRYEGRGDKVIGRETRDKLVADLSLLEKQVLDGTSIKPEDITDHSIAETMEELKHFVV